MRGKKIRRLLSIAPLFLTVGLALVVALRIILANPAPPDSWVHMAVGRYVLENKSIPQHTDISFKETDPSSEWLSHSWLSDTIVYISASISPKVGVLLLLIPILLLTLYFSSAILDLIGVSREVKYLSIAIASVLGSSFWKFHYFTLVAPLISGLVFLYLSWRRGNSRVIFWLIPLFFLWANLAGGFILIPALFVLCTLAFEGILKVWNKFLKEPLSPSRGKLSFLFLSAVLAILATLLNPSGLRIWTYIEAVFAYLGPSNKWFSTLSGALVASTSNFMKESLTPLFYFLFLIYLLLICFLFIFFLIREKTNFLKSVLPFVPLFPFLLLGFEWVRLIPIAVFGSIPLFAVILEFSRDKFAVSRFSSKLSRPLKAISTKPFYYLGVLAFLFFILLFPLPTLSFNPPKDQIKFIEENALPENLLPDPEIAGYAFYSLYPAKGYLDVQDDFFDESDLISVYTRLSSLSAGFFENLEKTYNINTVLVTKDTDFMTVYLNQDPDWALVYLDYNGFVFVKKDRVDKDFLEENALVEIDLARNLGFDPERASEAISELERFTQSHPESTLALGQLASIYRFQQNFQKAEEILMRIPQSKWNFVVMTEMGRVKAAQGLCESAEGWFLKAIQERKEQNLSKTVLDLAVLYAGCFNDKVKAKHYFQRYSSFPISPVEREKTIKIARDFGIALEEGDKEGK